MKKVTIITACYNGERFIDAYVNSVLSQTYQNMEVLFVNDGSIDSSGEKIKAYIPKFHESGVDFIYFEQENKGQASATNVAFQYMRGEYFMLHDIDDFMEPECIEKRVLFLEEHQNCGCVYSRIWRQYEGGDRSEYGLLIHTEAENWIFDKLVQKQQPLLPIAFLFRTAVFDEVYPEREIYDKCSMQDVQVILPITYVAKAGFINEFLATYLMHADSHSSLTGAYKDKRYEYWVEQESAYREAIRSVFSMPENERNKYEKLVHNEFQKYQQQEKALESFVRASHIRYCKELILFGAGTVGERVSKVLLSKGLRIKCFWDNNPANWGRWINGLEVQCVDRKVAIGLTVLICVRDLDAEFAQQMRKQLSELGIAEADYRYYPDFIVQLLEGEVV